MFAIDVCQCNPKNNGILRESNERQQIIFKSLLPPAYVGRYVGNIFSHVYLFVCLSVRPSISSGYNFWTPSHRNFIFGMKVHLCHIYVMFIKVIGPRLNEKKNNFYLFQHVNPLCVARAH